MALQGKPRLRLLTLAVAFAGLPCVLSAQTEAQVAPASGPDDGEVALAFSKAAARPAETVTAESVPEPAAAPEVKGPLLATANLDAYSLGGLSSDRIRQASSYPQPWIEATDWDDSPYSQSLFEARELELGSWDLFDGRLSFAEAPAWSSVPPPRPLFVVDPPYETQLAKKIKGLARRITYREIRRQAKKVLRRQFQQSPWMSYEFYRSRVVQVDNIGRDPEEFDDLDDRTTEEVKEDLFTDYRYAEAELPVLSVGPLTIMDTGSMRFDLGALTPGDGDGDADEPRLDVGEKKKSPFLADRNYRVDTSVKFNLNPGRGYRSGNALDAITSYGFSVDVDVLSDVLGREMLTTEFELEVDDHSDVAAFFNLVIKSRK